ncbi:glycerophosphodiester phosphodiesterase [Reinekea sp.]|jgi:glycerophosphoryl diester phosphodiesterase|uniref:glycerophosphodiester phosphodiesterase n=1 Tax=Reinekea sp. TaxID=1970455 RepID=UPI003988D73F
MKLLRILSRAFILMAVLYAVYFVAVPTPTVSEFARQQVDNIAHQGGNLEYPDSTLIAYDAALRSNVDVLEMDVHLTRDNHLVVIHDDTVDRTTNGKGAVADYTLAELKVLDAAYWWPYHSNDDVAKQQVPVNQDFPYRGAGATIPTLDEMFQRYPHHRFTIELKDNSDELRTALIAKIDEYDRWSTILVASFYLETLQQLRQAKPQAQTYAAESEIKLFYVLQLLRLEKLYPYSIDAFAVPMTSGGLSLATPRFIQAAHNAGILVHYWTINTEADMQQLLEIGADGIMTDRPALLYQLQTGRKPVNLL